MGSAITSSVAQQQNSNVLNDGSADSPRGWAISTDSIEMVQNYTFTNTGASRVRATATSASRTISLPTTGIKAGYEAEVVTACSGGCTVTIKSSDGVATIDTLKGTKGRIRLVALIDAPVAAADWSVVEVYDEGTWTPIVVGVTTAGFGTYSFQVGSFSRNGSNVTCQFGVAISAHTGSGNMRIGGFPFPGVNISNIYGHTAFMDFNTLTMPANSFPSGYISPNSTELALVTTTVGGASAPSALSLDTAFTMWSTISYRI